MKKTALAFSCMMISSVYAGDMGPAATSINTPFVGLEGLYAWNSFNTFSLNHILLNPNYNGWGGRVSVGSAQSYKNNISFSMEAGWGYYGHATDNNIPLAQTGDYRRYGFDLLFGVIKTYSNFDLFLKGGAFAATVRGTLAQDNLSLQYPGNFINGSKNTSATTTTVLPEVKVGGVYNMNDQLGISLAYMYVPGWTPRAYRVNSASSGSGINIVSNTYSGPATINALLLGLKYNFV